MATLLRLATAGSVDDGKSTLVGRLLYDSKSVLTDQLDAVARVSRDRGLEATDLALLTDGLRAEREQGITIDVAYRYFATARRSFILADCPGHVQYTRNTVTGASTADVVVLAPGLRMPRMAMHRCSASTTTMTPRGSSLRISASAIWLVSRSCTCGRLAYRSTSRASLDSPVTLPLGPGM